MDPDHLKKIQTSDETRKNMAKWLVYDCFRNYTNLEDLHARNGANKITDAEMKTLMKQAVNNVYLYLTILFQLSDDANGLIDLFTDKEQLGLQDWNKWDEPEMPEKRVREGAALFRRLQKRRQQHQS